MERGIVPPCITMEALAPQARTACRGPHLSRGRGGGSSCEAETCRATWRLVVGDPSCGELVGDAANWSEA
jgi:hypothetical protein